MFLEGAKKLEAFKETLFFFRKETGNFQRNSLETFKETFKETL
jgi:hypothetical protein